MVGRFFHEISRGERKLVRRLMNINEKITKDIKKKKNIVHIIIHEVKILKRSKKSVKFSLFGVSRI